MKKIILILAVATLIVGTQSCGSSHKGGCSRRPGYTPNLQF